MKTLNLRSIIPVMIIFLICALIAASLLLGSRSAQAAATDQETLPQAEVIYRGVSTAVQFDISPPLREIAPVPFNPSGGFIDDDPPSGLEGPLGPQDFDPSVQAFTRSGEIPAPVIGFDGFDNVLGYTPPDLSSGIFNWDRLYNVKVGHLLVISLSLFKECVAYLSPLRCFA